MNQAAALSAMFFAVSLIVVAFIYVPVRGDSADDEVVLVTRLAARAALLLCVARAPGDLSACSRSCG